MLFFFDALVNDLSGVADFDGDFGLSENAACIDLGGDEVNSDGGAGFEFAFVDGALHGVAAGELWQ